MEQFSPLLGLSSRVTENCDGDMLIRSGKPSSGIRRQVVTGPLLTCPLSHDVQPSETTTASYAGELLFYSTLILLAPVQRILDGITSTASRATLAKNRFWNTPSSPSPQSYTFIRTLSLSRSLSFSPYIPISLSSAWTFVGVSLSSRSIAGEDMSWCGSSESKGFPITMKNDTTTTTTYTRLILQ